MTITRKVVAGQIIDAADFRQYFGDHFSSFVKTGFEVSEGIGLVIDISAGVAYVKDSDGSMYQIVSDSIENATLADDNTNYVFLHSDNGAAYITDSTTATVPDDAILLAVVVTASGDVTIITNYANPTPLVESKQIWRGTTKTITPLTNSYINSLYGPVDHFEYLNVFENSLIKLNKLKFTVTDAGAGAISGTVYYNVGDGDVELGSFSGATNTYEYTISATQTNPSFNTYIKWTLSGTNSAGGDPTMYNRAAHNVNTIYVDMCFV